MQWCLHKHPVDDVWYLLPSHRMADFCGLYNAGMPHEPEWLLRIPADLHYSFLRFEDPTIPDHDLQARIRQLIAQDERENAEFWRKAQ